MDTRLSLLLVLLVAVLEVWLFTMTTTNRRALALMEHVLFLHYLVLYLLAWYISTRAGYLSKPKTVARLAFVTIILVSVQWLVFLRVFLRVLLGVVFVDQELTYITSISNTCLSIIIFTSTALVVIDVLALLVRKILWGGVEWNKIMPVNSDIQLRSSLGFFISVALTVCWLCGHVMFHSGEVDHPSPGACTKSERDDHSSAFGHPPGWVQGWASAAAHRGGGEYAGGGCSGDYGRSGGGWQRAEPLSCPTASELHQVQIWSLCHRCVYGEMLL